MEIADHIIRGNSGICNERKAHFRAIQNVHVSIGKTLLDRVRCESTNQILRRPFPSPAPSNPCLSPLPRRHPRRPFLASSPRLHSILVARAPWREYIPHPPLPFVSPSLFPSFSPSFRASPFPAMDMNYEESWCPTCDRQIMPKRFTVSVAQPPPEQPPAPPSAPADSTSRKPLSILGLSLNSPSCSPEKPASRRLCAHLPSKVGDHTPKGWRSRARDWPHETQTL